MVFPTRNGGCHTLWVLGHLAYIETLIVRTFMLGTVNPLAQWEEVKVAASEVIASAGGTITHHHAVGRDHRRWYDRQRPEQFAAVLRAAKAAVDPAGILNPGVLIDPQ